MKKAAFLLILFTSTLLVNAQDFAPIGAIWHYTQGTVNPDYITYKTLESVSDTTIQGIECRKIVEVGTSSSTIFIYHYMYSENDRVFFYADDNFHLLYDFGANKGDTVTLGYYLTHEGNPLQMFIDSTSIIMVNNQERKIQYITCGDGMVIEFGHHVIEGVGNTSFMFPTFDFSFDGPLRCYQDNNTGLFLNPFYSGYGWNHLDCEEIITGINEPESKESISVFPNPTQSNITVRNIDRATAYKIITISGRIVKQGIISESTELSLTELSKGIYFIEFESDNVLTVRKIVKN